jgi:hypothetical protein
MVVIKFDGRFKILTDKVKAGKKKQTIRPKEAYSNLKVGMKVHCYSTKRVPYSRRPVLDEKLYEGICTEIIFKQWREIKDDDIIAKLDDFYSASEMREWFKKQYKNKIKDDTIFKIIRWK